MNNPFDFFDKIYCINLDSRPDRWTEAQREFEKIGILDRVERFRAFDREYVKDKYGELVKNLSQNKLGQFGVTESSSGCIEDAKKYGAKNCLIFQDDVCFRNVDYEFLEKAFAGLPDDWECLFLGYECWRRHQLEIKYSDELIRVSKFWLAQAVANNGISFDKFYNNRMDIVKHDGTNHKHKIGVHEELLWNYNSFGLRYDKRIAFQSESKSDIDGVTRAKGDG